MRRVLLTSALLLATAVAGCGEGPAVSPSVGRPALDPSGEPFAFPAGGSIDLPASWDITAGPDGGPEVVRATSGQGAIVVWRYPRTEPLPTTKKDLVNTRRSLKAAATTRDPELKLTAALLRRVPEPAVELAGTGTMAGAKRSIRSLHVYADGHETVVECIGPLADAAQFNETICTPVIDSLSMTNA
ncbi:MAG: hypothetical protein JHD16_15200 [Solirubrobacteraceae bacterium]|nr:hypothetical protein [Solirubrobacteraceae bacterium]